MNSIPSTLHPYNNKKELYNKSGSLSIEVGEVARFRQELGLGGRGGGREQFDMLFLKPNQTKYSGFCGRHQVGSL